MMANKNINIDEVNELGPQIKMHLMIISWILKKMHKKNVLLQSKVDMISKDFDVL
jgi:hypothetical protein